MKECVWVEPTLSAQIEFLKRTEGAEDGKAEGCLTQWFLRLGRAEGTDATKEDLRENQVKLCQPEASQVI